VTLNARLNLNFQTLRGYVRDAEVFKNHAGWVVFSDQGRSPGAYLGQNNPGSRAHN